MESEKKKQAFLEAFEKHSDELFRHGCMRLSDRERSRELTQETFLRAWESVTRGEEIRQYRSFLYRILNNLIIDEYRKKKSQSLDAMLEDEARAAAIEGELLQDDLDLMEESMVRFDAARALAAMQYLPERYRNVLTLRYVDGFSPKEIAECIDESENVVSVRIHRALKKLRETIER